MVDADLLTREFRALYGGHPRVFAAPGRVNLIGEHTDYNDGFVLPMAIERTTLVAARARSAAAGRLIRARSRNQDDAAEIDLEKPGVKRRGIWIDYVEGVARALEARGARLCGADLLIDSDVPLGAGLSSSAALEISVATALLALRVGSSIRGPLPRRGRRPSTSSESALAFGSCAGVSETGASSTTTPRSLRSRAPSPVGTY
jgi:galactokinase